MSGEKVVVVIGAKPNDSMQSEYINRVKFLKRAFDISHVRAEKLVTDMNKGRTNLTVVLTYKQLARYFALRALEKLTREWEHPTVLELIEAPPAADLNPPIELRPDHRIVP